MLNTHDRTTLRCNHRILHHDFETALDHDDDDDGDDDDEGQPINCLSEHIGFLHFFLCRNKNNQACSSDQSISYFYSHCSAHTHDPISHPLRSCTKDNDHYSNI